MSTGGSAGVGGVGGSGAASGGAGGSSAGTGGGAGSGSGGSAANGGSGGAGSGGGSGAGGGSSFGISPQGASRQHALDAYAAFKRDYFVDCGDGRTRVASGIGSQETFSEGMGYGMLMVAYLEPDATGPALLSSLLALVTSKLDANGLMHWKVSCSEIWGQNAATDGDLDYALALVQGERRWPGNGFGSAAHGFIDAILAHATDACGLKPGDAWGGCDAEANPSYAALGYLDTFECFSGNAAWSNVRNNTMEHQLAYWFANYALPPDWVYVDASSTSGRFSRGNYGYDAARVPWRVGVDHLWHGKTDSHDQADKIVSRIMQSDPQPSTIGDGYDYQSGGKLSNNHNGVFVGPLAVAAMTDAAHQAWLDAAYAELVAVGESQYFGDALRVLSLIALTGSFENPCP
jgi:endo-1,4-beta-D-glucanase Y